MTEAHGTPMTDKQRNHLVQMLGPINAQAAKNKLEADFEAAKKHLHAFIKLRSIAPEDLPDHKLRKVVEDYNCMTIITDTGHYVHVSAEPGYHDTVDFGTGYPDIEGAHNMGILSQEQYDEYKKAQQAYLERHRKIDARNRLTNFVREVGAANVQGYLDEISQ